MAHQEASVSLHQLEQQCFVLTNEADVNNNDDNILPSAQTEFRLF